jgi:hypothetical protein
MMNDWQFRGLIIISFASLIFLSCHKADPLDAKAIRVKSEIQPGESRQSVEDVLKKEGLEYNFSAEDNSFYARVRSPRWDSSSSSNLVIKDKQIIIVLDKQNKVARIDMKDMLTGL